MINRKKKTCTSCGKDVHSFWKRGLCKFCASKTHKKLSSKKNIKAKDVNKKRNEMEEYFSFHILKCIQSENSNKIIHTPTRSNICHIFPKSKYISVRSLKENCVYLTLDEHSRFDDLLFRGKINQIEEEFSAQFLEILKNRIKNILPFVEESGSVKLNLQKILEL